MLADNMLWFAWGYEHGTCGVIYLDNMYIQWQPRPDCRDFIPEDLKFHGSIAGIKDLIATRPTRDQVVAWFRGGGSAPVDNYMVDSGWYCLHGQHFGRR